MINKIVGIRGLNPQLLSDLKAYIKKTHGKSKDKTGAYIARIINDLIAEFLADKMKHTQDAPIRKSKADLISEKIAAQVAKNLSAHTTKPTAQALSRMVYCLLNDELRTIEVRTIKRYARELQDRGIIDFGVYWETVKRAYERADQRPRARRDVHGY